MLSSSNHTFHIFCKHIFCTFDQFYLTTADTCLDTHVSIFIDITFNVLSAYLYIFKQN